MKMFLQVSIKPSGTVALLQFHIQSNDGTHDKNISVVSEVTWLIGSYFRHYTEQDAGIIKSECYCPNEYSGPTYP